MLLSKTQQLQLRPGGLFGDRKIEMVKGKAPQTSAKRATNRQPAKQLFVVFPLWLKPLEVAVGRAQAVP